MKYELREYVEDEKSPFKEWFRKLDSVTAARVDRYLQRMEEGNLGDSKAVGGGVSELRMHFGSGYRIYYGIDKGTLIILLGGGDKRRQSSDIAAAIRRWSMYQQAEE